MKIESSDKSIDEILNLGYYKIPRFQRAFSWEKEQIEDFWADVIVDNEGDYFIGSIVVYEESQRSKIFGIVDGQQRLTTITLTLCALRNAFNREGYTDLALGVHDLIERKNIDHENEFVLKPESSYPYFQEHIQKNAPPDVDVEVGEEEFLLKNAFDRIAQNIDDTLDAIKNDPSINDKERNQRIKEKLKQIRSKILGLRVIHITLDNEDDAYIIFETLNTRGKDLTIADLLKSHLLKPIKPKNADVDVWREKWAEIIKTITFEKELKMDEFLYHQWLSKYERYVPAKKLFKSIKSTIRADNAKSYFNELHKEAHIYRTIILPDEYQWNKNELGIKAALVALQIFKVKQQIPMLISVLREYKNSNLGPKQVISILEDIENFHFIFSAITSQRSSGGISGMYASHAIKLVKAKDSQERGVILQSLRAELKKRLPTYQEFEAEFTLLSYTDSNQKQKKLLQYVLAKLDSYHSNGLAVDYDKMTIEHLAPQHPKDGSPLGNVGYIGNLILVNQELNSQLDNRSFTKKLEILKASRVWIDKQISSSKDWGNEDIEDRSKNLAKLAYEKVWQL